ncbi:hypothetical protein, partial [Mycobacterium canetti]|uniref:hypothetical protein n=1 Tax=Mycobacterium canetti TaxID=78331 RepID=UPI001E284B38
MVTLIHVPAPKSDRFRALLTDLWVVVSAWQGGAVGGVDGHPVAFDAGGKLDERDGPVFLDSGLSGGCFDD